MRCRRGIWAKKTALSVLLLLTGACSGSPPSPSPPTPAPDPTADLAYVLVTGMNVARPGETAQLSAEARWPDGRSSNISRDSRWRTSNPGVATVTPTGLVTARGPGLAEVTATYRDGIQGASLGIHPTPLRNHEVPFYVSRGEAPPLAQYEGAWTGEARITECDRLHGAAGNPCTIGRVFPVRLTLSQMGGFLVGTLDMFESPSGSIRGSVRGMISEEEELVVGGTLRIESHGAVIQLREWRAQIDSSSDRLMGHVVEDRAFNNFFGPQLLRERSELLGLTRQR